MIRNLALALWLAGGEPSQEARPEAGVVCHIKLLSDKSPDVSSLEAWKRSFIRDGMSDAEKALAVWRSVWTYQHQDDPPTEFLADTDPIRIFNVYGYSQCGQASGNVAALARYVGLEARGRSINSHQVSEVFWDGAWHLLDASLINYFPKADGVPASVDEIVAGVTEWYEKTPGFKGNDRKLREFMRRGGWRQGPEVLRRCPTYDEEGWLPARTHGWYSTMQEYDGSRKDVYEHGYSQGYQVNLQLRPGERLTRNWGHKGMHLNRGGGAAPGCLKMATGSASLVYTPATGDLAPGRVGNGTYEYEVPLSGGAYRGGALAAENLTDAADVRDASRPGVLILRMPSSYVYLTGKLTLKAAVADGGSVAVAFSDNHGLDWKEVARIEASGEHAVDLSAHVLRRYDYRLKFELRGRGTGLDRLHIAHDIQHSQRPLPALGPGANAITFRAGPPEGTITIEGSTDLGRRGKQVVYTDFHPELKNITEPNIHVSGGKGEVTFRLCAPGDLVRLRFGAHYRARDARDGWDYQVSFDGGKTFQTLDRAPGPTPGYCKYTEFSAVPAGAREALVRFASFQAPRNATMIFAFRIDADYREPFGGFRPVKVTYLWEEEGRPRQDVHVARKPDETWTITCGSKPVMKSIVLELAD